MKKIIPILAASAVLLAASPLFLQIFAEDFVFLAGAGIALSYLVKSRTRRAILREGRNKFRKTIESLVETFVPLLAFASSSMIPAVTFRAGILSLLAVSSAIIMREKLSANLGKNIKLRFGLAGWLAPLSAGIFLIYSNAFFIFYGVMISTLIAILDIIDMLWKIRS